MKMAMPGEVASQGCVSWESTVASCRPPRLASEPPCGSSFQARAASYRKAAVVLMPLKKPSRVMFSLGA